MDGVTFIRSTRHFHPFGKGCSAQWKGHEQENFINILSAVEAKNNGKPRQWVQWNRNRTKTPNTNTISGRSGSNSSKNRHRNRKRTNKAKRMRKWQQLMSEGVPFSASSAHRLRILLVRGNWSCAYQSATEKVKSHQLIFCCPLICARLD